MKHQTLPIVSFIIPTLNAAHILPRCLHAITSQDYPKSNIEIIVADGGSTDATRAIAKQFGARIIENPDVLHEPGKSRASKIARGDILFYTDADNIVVGRTWVRQMIRPFMAEKRIAGLLPQTMPAPDSNPIDRYLGYLFTDPLTWFIYAPVANPQDWETRFAPYRKTAHYTIFQFRPEDIPLFGLSQGVGTTNHFKRTGIAYADDMMAGLQLIRLGGQVAYVPSAGVYHYHVAGLSSFIRKYAWRIRNNLTQQVKGMGLVHRRNVFSREQRIRMALFIPYSFTVVLPLWDAVKLTYRYNDPVMMLHAPMCITMALLILWELLMYTLGRRTLSTYG
jgi:glycosyltransferase involved in cell wall biosynthesis